MYRVYGYLGKMKLLDISPNEEDIIKTIDENISMEDMIYFLIIKNENGADLPYKTIHSFEDYIDYLEEYKNRNKKIRKFK